MLGIPRDGGVGARPVAWEPWNRAQDGTVDLVGVQRVLAEIGHDSWLMLETSEGDNPLDAARCNVALLRESFV